MLPDWVWLLLAFLPVLPGVIVLTIELCARTAKAVRGTRASAARRTRLSPLDPSLATGTHRSRRPGTHEATTASR